MVVTRFSSRSWTAFSMADSYGYRPGKSAKEALGVRGSDAGVMIGCSISTSKPFSTRSITPLDARGSNGTRRARGRFCTSKMAQRAQAWRTVVSLSGLRERRKVVSSANLANLYLHYAFDLWIGFGSFPASRSALRGRCDLHCRSEVKLTSERRDRAALRCLFLDVASAEDDDRLLLRCRRKGTYPTVQFDFSRYTFRPREVRRNDGVSFRFQPRNQREVSPRYPSDDAKLAPPSPKRSHT